MGKALLNWPVVLQYDVKAKYRLISRDFSSMKFFSRERSINQPKATRVCIRLIDQSNRSISVRLLFLFCSRVVISRSYENRSNAFHLTVVLFSSPMYNQTFTFSLIFGRFYSSHSIKVDYDYSCVIYFPRNGLRTKSNRIEFDRVLVRLVR